MHAVLANPVVGWIALLGLCAAYIQGGLNKLLDFPGAVAEAAHFGLPLPPLTAALTIALELGASALILAGRLRWARRWRWPPSPWRRPSSPTASGSCRPARSGS
jgi:uncharacterized membrane protein YphA (DoxX/SURF4 family)